MKRLNINTTVLWILGAVLAAVLITGILLPKLLPPPEPESPLARYDFTDCQIVMHYGQFAVSNLDEQDREAFLDLLGRVTVEPQEYEGGLIGGRSQNYGVHLKNGETVQLFFHNTEPNDSSVIYLSIGNNGYRGIGDPEVLDQLLQPNPVYEAFETLLYQTTVHAEDFSPELEFRELNLGKAVVIEKDAFRGFDTLERIQIQNGVRELHTGAFRDCPKLKEVYFMGEIKGLSLTLEPGVFDPNVTLFGPPGGTVEAYAKAEGLTFLPLPTVIEPLD